MIMVWIQVEGVCPSHKAEVFCEDFDNFQATSRHSDLAGYPYFSNHQVVFVPATEILWMKVIDLDWQKVEIAPLFAM